MVEEEEEERVCCMCGDVGFPHKLFQCSRCRFRFQHSYCSNYYYGNEAVTTSTTLCDWCLSEGRNNNTSSSSSSTSSTSTANKHHIKRSLSMDNNHHHLHIRSEYSTGERIKQHDNPTATNNNNASSPTASSAARNSGIPSPRTGTHRRYKLLKDVMC